MDPNRDQDGAGSVDNQVSSSGGGMSTVGQVTKAVVRDDGCGPRSQPAPYSFRSAVTGAMDAARKAGMTPANAAKDNSAATAPPTDSGSNGAIW